MYSRTIQQLIRSFRLLPGVGTRTAERYVFSLLKSGKKDVAELTLALQHLIQQTKSCQMCWNFSDQDPCPICANPSRDTHTICVVSEPQDVEAFEKTRSYTGVYHVLRGIVSADISEEQSQIKLPELFARVEGQSIREVILAFNFDLRGETTMMMLETALKMRAPNIIVSRLARGLPTGSDLQYADDATLKSALVHRQSRTTAE